MDNQGRGHSDTYAGLTAQGEITRNGAGFGPGPERPIIVSRAMAIAAAACASLLFVASGPAVADEVQVSTTWMQDFEFDHDHAALQFVDQQNNLWVGKVNTTTGAFMPASGEGVLVDTNAALASDFGNGPEYVEDTAGYSIVYNKYQPGTVAADQSANTAFLAKASPTSFGGWQITYLPNSAGMVDEEGNLNPSQANPYVVAEDGIDSGHPAVRIEGINSTTPYQVPNSYNVVGSYRFVTGMNAMIYSEPVSGSTSSNRQVFMYYPATNTTTQLTTDSGDKEFVQMYLAPEFNAYVLSAQVNNTTLRLYRQMTVGSSAWTAFQTIAVPSGAPAYIYKPTPFVYNNKSYFFMERLGESNPEDFTYPTQIWVASLDGTINQQVSNPSLSEVRNDPKWYATAQGVFIYYNVYTVASLGVGTQSLGVWRSNSTIPLANASKAGSKN